MKRSEQLELLEALELRRQRIRQRHLDQGMSKKGTDDRAAESTALNANEHAH
jgi:hypothetical protein